MRNIAIYVRRKRRDYSLKLMRHLRDRGHHAFRVTPERGASRWGDVADADVILNWGCSTMPDWNASPSDGWINPPESVGQMSNKLKAFRFFDNMDIACVSWTPEREVAQAWLDEGRRVVVRKVLQGHSGEGIEVCQPGVHEVPDAPLYTKMTRGSRLREFRFLFYDGGILLAMRKRRRNGFDGDPLIRTHANGWVYCVNDLFREGENEARVTEAAANMIWRLHIGNIDFGALDIIADIQTGMAWALEVNTAPGLASPSTTAAVVRMFDE